MELLLMIRFHLLENFEFNLGNNFEKEQIGFAKTLGACNLCNRIDYRIINCDLCIKCKIW